MFHSTSKIKVIEHISKKKPFRGNGTASNDCLPYEKFV